MSEKLNHTVLDKWKERKKKEISRNILTSKNLKKKKNCLAIE